MHRSLVPTILAALLLPAIALAETPPDQQDAIDALRQVRSNLQMNRDGTVRFVRFSKAVVTDEHMQHLRAFKQLDYLAVVTPTVTDAGIAHVADLTNLDTLVLADSGLTDDGLKYLEKLSKVEHLFLENTSVSGQQLPRLKAMRSLKTLTLDNTRVSDAGLETLAGFPELNLLSLRNTDVTNDGLKTLATLPKLSQLVLDGTAITSAATLAEMPHLEEVSLCGCELDVAGLMPLAGHPKLKRLLLYGTPFDRPSQDQLRASLPNVLIAFAPTPEQSRNPWQRLLAGETLREAIRDPEGDREDDASGDTDPTFQRHIVPLLGRLGCNGRTCHGSFQGKGGFQLSMFGYDFAADHKALVGGDNPRVDVANPADSLILTHPTTEDHGGGIRFRQGGAEYQRISSWIEAGARGADGTPQKLVRLDVSPREMVFGGPGETVQMKAVAVWADGTQEDVTSLARFQTNDDAVASVSPTGLVTSASPGDTWIISFYDSAVVQTQVIQPIRAAASASQESAPQEPDASEPVPQEPTRIDQLVAAKLKKLGIRPSGVCSDETFLRRVSLDIAGTLPTAEQVRSFADDAAPDKRARLVDALLKTPAYAQWWAMWLSDLTGSNSQHLGLTDMNRSSADQWNAWLLRRVQENVGWHRIAAGMILAESRRPGEAYDGYAAVQSNFLRRGEPTDFTALDNPMHYYWFRGNNQQPQDRALSFGYIFLGVRLQCAQCHKHPFDRWSKQDFDRFTQFFTRVKAGVATSSRETQRRLKTKLGVPKKLDTAALRRQMYQRVATEGLPIPWNEVWIEPPGKKPQLARILGGEDFDLNEWDDPREPLVAWLLRKDNPYFAPAFVNRVWERYFGVGIVDPPDDFNLANPPSNKALLTWLSAEFIAHDYDIQWLHRTIAGSLAYQRDWRPNETNLADTKNFSRAQVRRLPAEVTVDAIRQASAADARASTWSVDLKDRKIAYHPLSIQAARLDYSLLVFGKPLRTTNCDCERQAQPTLLQSLFVRNDREIFEWLDRADGWLAQTGKDASAQNASAQNTDERIVEAYYRTVSRAPTDAEIARARAHFDDAESSGEGLRDLMWALLNTREFLTNH